MTNRDRYLTTDRIQKARKTIINCFYDSNKIEPTAPDLALLIDIFDDLADYWESWHGFDVDEDA